MSRFLSFIGALIVAIGSFVVILQYLKIEPKVVENKPSPIRAEYYRMRGASADFLLRGLLTEEWRKIFGGQQDIMQNDVLISARAILENFNEKHGGIVSDSILQNKQMYWEDYSKTIDPTRYSTSHGEVYLGGKEVYDLFIPDIDAMKVYVNSPNVPDGYNVFHMMAAGGGSYPALWRYVRIDDLNNYTRSMRRYLESFPDREKTYLGADYSNPHIVKGLRWLIRNGLPEKFVLATVERAMHGGLVQRAWMRDLELEVLLIENIGNEPVSVSDFGYKTWGDNELRESEITDKYIGQGTIKKRKLLASSVLSAGEKVIVPIRISFVYKKKFIDFFTNQGIERDPHYPSSGSSQGLLDITLAYKNPHGTTRSSIIVKKNKKDILKNDIPFILERFDYGPTWRPETISVNGKTQKIRQADWKNLTLYFGWEKGSCPYLFTRSSAAEGWSSEGPVLVGAVSRDLSKVEVKNLKKFDGTLLIRELEDEISYINSVRILVDVRDGGSDVLLPSKNFKSEIIVTKGRGVLLKFDGYRPDVHYNPRVEISGYYRPFALHNMSLR